MSEADLDALRTEHFRLLAEVGPLRTVLDWVVLYDDAPLPGELPWLAGDACGVVQDRGEVSAP